MLKNLLASVERKGRKVNLTKMITTPTAYTNNSGVETYFCNQVYGAEYVNHTISIFTTGAPNFKLQVWSYFLQNPTNPGAHILKEDIATINTAGFETFSIGGLSSVFPGRVFGCFTINMIGLDNVAFGIDLLEMISQS